MPASGKKGNKGGTGNPGYGTLNLVRQNVKKYCPLWWEEWAKMMQGADTNKKKFAMGEFNKLQTKMMPTVLANDDEKPIIIQFNDLFTTTSKTGTDNPES